MSADSPLIVVSSGEPAGIGPDLCVLLGGENLSARLAVLGDPRVLEQRAALLGIPLALDTVATLGTVREHVPGSLCVLPVATPRDVTPGRLETANASYVLELLETGARACQRGDADALVTAPVQKSVINDAGVRFSGHTEFLAELTGCPLPVMLLAGRTCRVALATTHLPLRAVPDALDPTRLRAVLEVLASGLERRFGIESPRILVLGLNPHAGEGGHLGREEIAVIAPVVESLAASGMRVAGPVAADTAFTPESLSDCDAVLAMYHDQGLAPLKALSFGEVVNVTLGLPIIRTSVDHGTALALAGSGKARPGSLLAAVHLAVELARRAAAS